MESRVAIAELKANLSRYLRLVKAGEEIVVTERNVPVARLAPLSGSMQDEERLAQLAERGLVRIGTGRLGKRFAEMPRPADPGATVRSAVADERRDGR